MSLLSETIQKIPAIDQTFYEKALDQLANQARPAGSLGMLEDASARLAAIKKTLDVRLPNKYILTCAGDHGIVAEGVSLFPQEVTAQMVYNFLDGGASINVLAKHAGARVMVADFGVNHSFEPELPIFHKKIRKGTNNFFKEPAMSREDAIAAIEAGIETVNEICDPSPVDMIGTGDMGIGNTSPSTAIIAAFSKIPVKQLTDRGTGLDDNGLSHKTAVIDAAIKRHAPDAGDPIDVLSKVGGYEIGGIAGIVIGAAANKIPVLSDGLISTAGTLIATELAPAVKDYLFAAHQSVEIGHQYMLSRINIQPLLNLDMRLGEGTGAALAMEILDAATRVLAEIKTFDEVRIKNAHKNP
ncbi:MAG: nicotinate-nucleotide--dimethylbenzimidazole phosphoribosyltransferase [Desulfobacterales bacterium]|nr:nicotinate-nucleotide--dimethylbenzimidazole phosphoribosyltransferase [Desulfobacterales bacterium]